MSHLWFKGNVSAVVAAVATILAGQTATAQDVAPGANDRLVLEEVVVSARKRDETLIDVPLTVTAVSAARIEELGIRDSRDLALYTPGFSNVASFGRSSTERPVIRGSRTSSAIQTPRTSSTASISPAARAIRKPPTSNASRSSRVRRPPCTAAPPSPARSTTSRNGLPRHSRARST
jgi:outer membrane receptor protein involved in Fe transport